MPSTAPPTDPSPDESLAPDDRSPNPVVRWLLQYVVPLGGSLTLHVVLIAALMLTTWQVIERRQDTGPKYDVGIVGTDTSEGGFDWDQQGPVDAPDSGTNTDSTAMNFAGLSDLADKAAGQGGSKQPAAQSGGGFGIDDDAAAALLGIGGGAAESGDAGFGSGIGSESALGSAGVWNLSARGNRFVYVVDFSGSISVAVNDLRRELKRSIGNLRPTQSFDVVIFYSVSQPGRVEYRTESFTPTLQPATTRCKHEFFRWIDSKRPDGETQPLPAIRRALALRPDAVFFFSDGAFADKRDEIIEAIVAAADQSKTRIHCLVFDDLMLYDRSDLPQRASREAQNLQEIAKRTGGKCKIVTGRDLNAQAAP